MSDRIFCQKCDLLGLRTEAVNQPAERNPLFEALCANDRYLSRYHVNQPAERNPPFEYVCAYHLYKAVGRSAGDCVRKCEQDRRNPAVNVRWKETLPTSEGLALLALIEGFGRDDPVWS